MRIALLLFLCFSQTMLSQTVIWDGGGNGVNWADDGNWDTDVAPVAGDSVIIAADSVVVSVEDASMKNLHLINGAKLVNNRTITFSGSLSYAFRLFNNSSVINHGKIIVLNAGNNTFGDRALSLSLFSDFHNTSSGVLNIEQANGSGITITSNCHFENDGVITVTALFGSGIDMDEGSFTNSNQIDIICQDSCKKGIGLNGAAHFSNLGKIELAVSPNAGLLSSGLIVTSGGTFVNDSSLIITCENGSRGIVVAEVSALLHQKSGTIQINLSSSNGIWLADTGELRIDAGAIVEVNNPPIDYYLDMEQSAILDCQGIFDLGN